MKSTQQSLGRQTATDERRSFTADIRGISTPVTHAFTLGITALLLVGLLTATGSFLEDQQRFAAEDQIETVGNQIATHLQQAAQFANESGSATVYTNQPRDIVGSEYRVQLETGSTCTTGSFSTNRCLVLSVESKDLSQKFPVKAPSGLALEVTETGGSTFVLSATGSGGGTGTTAMSAMSSETTMSVGISDGIDVNSYGRVLDPTNRAPIPEFVINPDYPTSQTGVQIDASESSDTDGSIISYQWYVDGTQTGSNAKTLTETLPPGKHNVTLVVEDDEGSTATRTRSVRVSGLVYNNDMVSNAGNNNGGGPGVCAEFSMTNEWSEEIRLSHVSVDPPSKVNFIEFNQGYELLFDLDDDGTYDRGYETGRIEVKDKPDGVVLSLRRIGGNTLALDPGQTVSASVCKFKGGGQLQGQNVYPEFGFRYWIDGVSNRTVFDGSAKPAVLDYSVESTTSGMTVSFKSPERLPAFNGELGGDGTSATFTESDFSETTAGGYYTYEASFSRSPGTYYAKLTHAESQQGVTARGIPKNETTTVLGMGGDYVWQSASDWDASQQSNTVVHDAIGDREATVVQLGHAPGSVDSSLVSYWPLDGGSAVDVVGSNDGIIQGSPSETAGIGDTSALRFDGDDDHIVVPADSSLEMSGDDRVTVSMWVNKHSAGSGWTALLQKSDRSYNMQFQNGNEFEFTIYDGGWQSSDDENVDYSNSRYYHLVGTFDGADIRSYVDGTLAGSGTANEITDASGHDIGIGANLDTGGRHVDASIDDIRIYDDTLSASQVQQLHDVTQGSIVTDKRSGSTIDKQKLQVGYDAAIDSGESITLEVFAEVTKGNGNTKTIQSDTITLDAADSGTGVVDVSGINKDADTFWVRAELQSPSTKRSPELDAVQVMEAN